MTDEYDLTVEADSDGAVVLHIGGTDGLAEENLTVKHDEDRERALISVSGFEPGEEVAVQKLNT